MGKHSQYAYPRSALLNGYKRASPEIQLAYQELAQADQAGVDRLVVQLMAHVPGVGPGTALEIAYLVGRWMVKSDYVMEGSS
jgi:hypothetical protein